MGLAAIIFGATLPPYFQSWQAPSAKRTKVAVRVQKGDFKINAMIGGILPLNYTIYNIYPMPLLIRSLSSSSSYNLPNPLKHRINKFVEIFHCNLILPDINKSIL